MESAPSCLKTAFLEPVEGRLASEVCVEIFGRGDAAFMSLFNGEERGGERERAPPLAVRGDAICGDKSGTGRRPWPSWECSSVVIWAVTPDAFARWRWDGVCVCVPELGSGGTL